ncbi:MAG TPA: hypothetical protein VFI31_07290 [Pirellulales bacterium]|nr:hypothetical protein [Pirellulales bacterium]
MLDDGQLIVGGNLLSQTTIDGGISGTLAVKGNVVGVVGNAHPGPQSSVPGGITANGRLAGQLLVLGNITSSVLVNGDVTGQAVVLGTVANPGSLAVHGGIKDGGVLALQGNVSGSLVIDGGIDAESALIAGGNLGSTAMPFQLNGPMQGILAAIGGITTNRPLDSRHAAFYGASLGASTNTQALSNASAINSAFGALDADDIDLIGQSLLVALKNGQLALTVAPLPNDNDGDSDNDSGGGGPWQDGAQGFDSFFQELAGSSAANDLSLWSAGIQ